MWHALRAELAYGRSWLAGGLGIGAAISLFVSVVFTLVDSSAPSHVVSGLRGMFVIMAPMVVGFIIQAYRVEERRLRLLQAGPLTPRQVAGVTVLLSVALLGVGVVAGGLVFGVGFLITGRLEVASLHMAGYVGGLLFMMMQMGPLAQEASAALRQQRLRAAMAGWASFVMAVVFLAVLSAAAFFAQGPLTWITLHVGNLTVAVAAMGTSVALYAGRNDFTQ